MMPELAVDALEVAHDDVAGRRVEARDRLVGEDDRRLLRERARDPHPLLLAARQVARADVGLLDDADPLEGLHRDLDVLGPVPAEQRAHRARADAAGP